jgi:hypothetical protein
VVDCSSVEGVCLISFRCRGANAGAHGGRFLLKSALPFLVATPATIRLNCGGGYRVRLAFRALRDGMAFADGFCIVIASKLQLRRTRMNQIFAGRAR